MWRIISGDVVKACVKGKEERKQRPVSDLTARLAPDLEGWKRVTVAVPVNASKSKTRHAVRLTTCFSDREEPGLTMFHNVALRSGAQTGCWSL